MQPWSPFGTLFYAFPTIQHHRGRLDMTIPHGAIECSEGEGSDAWFIYYLVSTDFKAGIRRRLVCDHGALLGCSSTSSQLSKAVRNVQIQ